MEEVKAASPDWDEFVAWLEQKEVERRANLAPGKKHWEQHTNATVSQPLSFLIYAQLRAEACRCLTACCV